MKRHIVIHPFLFAVFPVLFLFVHNIRFVKISEIYLPIGIIASLTLLLWVLFGLFVKNQDISGVIISVFLFMFFSYGHLFNITKNLTSQISNFMRERYFLSVWSITFFIFVYFIQRIRKNLHTLTKVLNFLGAFMVTAQVVTIGFHINFRQPMYREQKQPENIKLLSVHPDIYYIIVDGYARTDVLRELYGYDNSEFLQYLRKKNFYIADKSMPNYPWTTLSLASSLNFEYLDNLVNCDKDNSKDYRPFMYEMLDSRVTRFLKSKGYKILSSSPEYVLADMYFIPRWSNLTLFQSRLIATTPISAFTGLLFSRNILYNIHRKKILTAAAYISKISHSNSRVPIFVFAHFLIPHPPFAFDKDGNPINSDKEFSDISGTNFMKVVEMTQDEFIQQYIGQVIFVNNMLKGMIDNLLSSATPPVIILQSDHGPSLWYSSEAEKANLKERHSILNAFYFPTHDYGQLYKSITPVNTFRVLFNRYFGQHYELLPDRSYFVVYAYPCQRIDVTDDIVN